MRRVGGDVMKRAGRHDLSPQIALLIHQQEHPLARGGAIELGTGAHGVEVALGHEVLVTDASGLDDRRAPKETAFGTGRNRLPELDAVDDGFRVHGAQGVGVVKNLPQVAEAAC